jgi:hypothetical protein
MERSKWKRDNPRKKAVPAKFQNGPLQLFF